MGHKSLDFLVRDSWERWWEGSNSIWNMIQYDTILKRMHIDMFAWGSPLPLFFSRCAAHFPIFKDLRLVQQSNKGRLSAVSSRRDSAHSFKSANSISVLADGCWFSTRKERMLVMWLLLLLLLLLLAMVNCMIGDDILPCGFGIFQWRKIDPGKTGILPKQPNN